MHPDEVGQLNEEKLCQMEALLKRDKMIAVGEIGLDYYWDKENRDLQKPGLSVSLSLPESLKAGDYTQQRSGGGYNGDNESLCF